MDFQTIREVFSKANIVVTAKSLSVVYTDRGKCIEQDFFNDNLRGFLELSQESEWISVDIKKNGFVKISFGMVSKVEYPEFYPAIEEEEQPKSIEEIMLFFDDEEIENFANLFKDVDVQDENAVLERFGDVFERGLSKNNTSTFVIHQRWKAFYEAFCLLVAAGVFCEYSVDLPNGDIQGIIKILLKKDTRGFSPLFGDRKEKFEKLLSLSDGMGFNILVSDGEFEILIFG